MPEKAKKTPPVDELMIFPILLAGGSGTRLWPISRTQAPKQLVGISGETSLLQETIRRLHPALCVDNLRVVCGNAHCDESSQHLAALGLTPENKIIGEPVGRNTAPAILLAVLKVLDQIPARDALFFILPADHVIGDVARFHERVGKAVDLAEKGYLVTFGIQPDYPETGYGYIKGGKPVRGGGLTIERFVEKPDVETARSYVEAGNFFWNSGMFAFRASIILNEFRQFEPDMVEKMTAMVQKGASVSARAYELLPKKSFDVAIMEKTSKGVVLPSDFGWSDIGSWKSLHAYLPGDAAGNVIAGDVIATNTRNSLIIAKSRLVAVNDLFDTAIVETPDAVLVSRLETSSNVKDIVSILEQKNRRECRTHLQQAYAWGTIQYLEKGDDLVVAKLLIKPNAAYRMNPACSMRLHICLLAGDVRVIHAEALHRLKVGESLSLDVVSEATVENSGGNDVLAIITHQ